MFTLSGLLCVFMVGLVQSEGTDCGNGLTAYLHVTVGSFDLFAGQNIKVGVVTATLVDNDANVKVCYEITENGWEIEQTHLWIGDTAEGYPQTNKGAPKIGHFPYTSDGSTSCFTMSLASVSTTYHAFDDLCGYCSDPNNVISLFMNAHAVVSKIDASGYILQTETAWSNGRSVVERGTWATQSELQFTVVCLDGRVITTVTPAELACETAWAKDRMNVSENSHCFINDPLLIAYDFSRWGWTNGIYYKTDGLIEFNIYAAAGQCDITKGTLVGYATLNTNTGEINSYMENNDGWLIYESHYYLGNEILPRNNNNVFTVAPGQFPIVKSFGEDPREQDNELFDVTDLNSFYMAVHFTVCHYT